MGSATFCRAVRYGSRLREVCCHTKPTIWRRYATRSSACIAMRSQRPTRTRPAVGASIPESTASSVDLPEPLAPTTATISPSSTSRSSPWSACTSTLPDWKMRTRLSQTTRAS